MPEVSEGFREWCVLEIMGHKKFAGLVTEQSIGGTSFVRVDVPALTDIMGQPMLPAFTKLFGAASIYCISPCTEETARRFAASLQAEAFNRYELPRLAAPPHQATDEAPDYYDSDDQGEDYYDADEDVDGDTDP